MSHLKAIFSRQLISRLDLVCEGLISLVISYRLVRFPVSQLDLLRFESVKHVKLDVSKSTGTFDSILCRRLTLGYDSVGVG